MKYIKSTSKNLPAKAGIDDLLLGFEVFTFLKGFLGFSSVSPAGLPALIFWGFLSEGLNPLLRSFFLFPLCSELQGTWAPNQRGLLHGIWMTIDFRL